MHNRNLNDLVKYDENHDSLIFCCWACGFCLWWCRTPGATADKKIEDPSLFWNNPSIRLMSYQSQREIEKRPRSGFHSRLHCISQRVVHGAVYKICILIDLLHEVTKQKQWYEYCTTMRSTCFYYISFGKSFVCLIEVYLCVVNLLARHHAVIMHGKNQSISQPFCPSHWGIHSEPRLLTKLHTSLNNAWWTATPHTL